MRVLLVSFFTFVLVAPAHATVRPITPAGPSLAEAYAASIDGDVIELAGGEYEPQTLPAGTKAVTVRAAAGQTPDLAELVAHASNVTVSGLKLRHLTIAGGSHSVYERLDIDGRFAKRLTLEMGGDAHDVTLRDSRVGNVTDEKGAIIGETGFTVDNVVFHDVLVTDSHVHNECVYATGAEGLTIRNSVFINCATMDLFFTNYAGGPDYGNITVENNVFEHSMREDREWHYYSLFVGNTGPSGADLRNWVVRNNTFEIDARVSLTRATGSRWVGNLGGWDCVSGVAYRHNVGTKCGVTDKRVSPDSSTRIAQAPFGWLSPATHDFRLTAGSPAIDAGDPDDHPMTDRDGLLRVGAPDAGAHEFGGRAVHEPSPPPGVPASSGSSVDSVAPRVRSARLAPRTICRRARRGCPSAARLRVAVSEPARVSVRLTRNGRRIKAMGVDVRAQRTLKLRARGLRGGRYRVRVYATHPSGLRSSVRVLALRVR
jgi:hypothetical protein